MALLENNSLPEHRYLAVAHGTEERKLHKQFPHSPKSPLGPPIFAHVQSMIGSCVCVCVCMYACTCVCVVRVVVGLNKPRPV